MAGRIHTETAHFRQYVGAVWKHWTQIVLGAGVTLVVFGITSLLQWVIAPIVWVITLLLFVSWAQYLAWKDARGTATEGDVGINVEPLNPDEIWFVPGQKGHLPLMATVRNTAADGRFHATVQWIDRDGKLEPGGSSPGVWVDWVAPDRLLHEGESGRIFVVMATPASHLPSATGGKGHLLRFLMRQDDPATLCNGEMNSGDGTGIRLSIWRGDIGPAVTDFYLGTPEGNLPRLEARSVLV